MTFLKPMMTATAMAVTTLLPAAAMADTQRPGLGAAVMNLLGIDSNEWQEIKFVVKQRKDDDGNDDDRSDGDDDRSNSNSNSNSGSDSSDDGSADDDRDDDDRDDDHGRDSGNDSDSDHGDDHGDDD